MSLREKIIHCIATWSDEYDSADPEQFSKLADAILATLQGVDSTADWQNLQEADSTPDWQNLQGMISDARMPNDLAEKFLSSRRMPESAQPVATLQDHLGRIEWHEPQFRWPVKLYAAPPDTAALEGAQGTIAALQKEVATYALALHVKNGKLAQANEKLATLRKQLINEIAKNCSAAKLCGMTCAKCDEKIAAIASQSTTKTGA